MSAKKTALITGVTGQDGAYLAKLLLEKNYRVVGAVRRASTLNLPRLAALNIDRDVELQTLDVQDLTCIVRMIETIQPDEIYNLSGQSSPQASFQQPLYTGETSGLGTLRLLEAIRLMKASARFYQASSSEIFGQAQGDKQNETTDFRPKSPYGVAKLYAHWMVINYRQAYDLHASSGILFSHESQLRGMDFVTRKITTTLAQIACGSQEMLQLGNVDNARDWGFAGDYVEAMWRMVQQEVADDFVIATGQTHSVRDFVNRAATVMGFDLAWEGRGVDAKGFDAKTGRQIVGVSPHFYRPSEPDPMIGDASKAHRILGWKPKIDFEKLVIMMAESDLERARNGQVWY
jgi:GDPmannose 4,6-dehydratase